MGLKKKQSEFELDTKMNEEPVEWFEEGGGHGSGYGMGMENATDAGA